MNRPVLQRRPAKDGRTWGVNCNGTDFAIGKYDPYHDKWTVTAAQTDKLNVTMVTGPPTSTGRYDVMILVAGTKYPARGLAAH